MSQAAGVAFFTAPPIPPKAPEVSIRRLPVTGKDLFGRQTELAWLDECWDRGAYVASIIAWGGVGKSALVNAWLARMRDAGWRGAERVFGWSFYSQGTDRLSSSDEFIEVALRWFGDANPSAGLPWDKGERLAALMRKQRTILVLDGVEPLQWGPGVVQGNLKDPTLQALVKELGAQNMGLCLITSRLEVTDLEPWRGDKVQAHGLDHLSEEAGAELLKARGAKGPKEELLKAAKEYKGHSLALTLLGSYLDEKCRGDIRQRKEIGPLEGEERQGTHARRVMAAYQRWFDRGPERGILRMLGLFDRPAGEDEIAALKKPPLIPGLTDVFEIEDWKWYHVFTQFLGPIPTHKMTEQDWERAVTKLRRAGLLAAEEGNGLDAHPLVREYFGEQLKREQPKAWREGHRRLYEHLKQKAKPLPETVEEMAPLYAAMVHGCLAGLNREAELEVHRKRIRRGNEYFSIRKLGAFSSEVAALSAFFDPPWERLAPGLSEADGAVLLGNAGSSLRALGRLHEAAALMRMSLAQGVAQKNWKEAALRANNLSEILQARGELDEAFEQAKKSVEFADKSGDASERLIERTTLAATQHAMGLWKEAAAQFEEAERMQKEWQPEYPLLYSVSGFRYCDLLLDKGLDADVQERTARFFDWRVPSDSLLDIALDHLSLGRAHLLAIQHGTGGDLAQAASHVTAAVDGLRRAGTQHHFPLGLLARAALYTHTRTFTLARKDLDEARALSERCGLRLHEADAHLGYARLVLAEGSPTSAGTHLARARTIIDETGYHRRDGELADLEAQASR